MRRRWRDSRGGESVQFTEKTKELIRDRSKGQCELCGAPAVWPMQIHHRKPRGMGGTKNPASRSPANGLYLHFRCHERIERNREEGLGYGWLVRQSGESEQEPVLLHYGWVLLNSDGTVQVVASLRGEKYQSLQQHEDESEDSTLPSSLSTSE